MQARIAPSLGELEGKHQDVWGTTDYISREEPTVFMGLYDVRDFWALWRHKGKAYVLWCGSDLRNLRDGFVLNDGKLRLVSKIPFGQKLVLDVLKKAEHWVENGWEYKVLKSLGFEAHIAPSFMGNVDDYELEYIPGNKVYLSTSKGRQEEYGFGTIERIASQVPLVQFHLYGDGWQTRHKNVFVHGRVPKEQMNNEIKKMQCGVRLNETDGFSEVTAKAFLWGQYAICRIPTPFALEASTDEELLTSLRLAVSQTRPNTEARDFYKYALNRYLWNLYAN